MTGKRKTLQELTITDEFLFGAEAFLNLRNNKIQKQELLYASDPVTVGLPAAIRVLFYDFHVFCIDLGCALFTYFVIC